MQDAQLCEVSKLQTEIALSTAEAEYIALSQAIREIMLFMSLLSEIEPFIKLKMPKPGIHRKVFEDNNSCIAMTVNRKFTPRTKHIVLKCHHFKAHVKSGAVKIFPIDTKEQTGDIFTKPLEDSLFIYLRRKLMGWYLYLHAISLVTTEC